jgi:hypothetical protein
MKQEAHRIFPAAVLSVALLLVFLVIDPPVLIIGWVIVSLLIGLLIGVAFNSYSLWKIK